MYMSDLLFQHWLHLHTLQEGRKKDGSHVKVETPRNSLGASELQADDVEHFLAGPAALVVLGPLSHLHSEVVLPRNVNHIQLSHGA